MFHGSGDSGFDKLTIESDVHDEARAEVRSTFKKLLSNLHPFNKLPYAIMAMTLTTTLAEVCENSSSLVSLSKGKLSCHILGI